MIGMLSSTLLGWAARESTPLVTGATTTTAQSCSTFSLYAHSESFVLGRLCDHGPHNVTVIQWHFFNVVQHVILFNMSFISLYLFFSVEIA